MTWVNVASSEMPCLKNLCAPRAGREHGFNEQIFSESMIVVCEWYATYIAKYV